MSKNRLSKIFGATNPCLRKTRVGCLLSLCIWLVACSQKADEAPTKVEKGRKFAKIYDRTVYFSELKPYVDLDSATMVKGYLDQVTREEAMLHRAKELSKLDLEEVEEKTTRFRNSLLVLRFQQAYLKQHLDSHVTDAEIKQVYQQNPSSFVNEQDIFIGYYVKIPLNTPRIGRLKELLASEKPNDFHELKSICLRYASKFMIEGKSWQPVPTVFKSDTRLHNGTAPHLVRSKEVLSLEKDEDLHLIRLFDFRMAKQPSPVAYAHDKIKTIVLNKRKAQLLSRLNEELLQDAKSNNHIEIY